MKILAWFLGICTALGLFFTAKSSSDDFATSIRCFGYTYRAKTYVSEQPATVDNGYYVIYDSHFGNVGTPIVDTVISRPKCDWQLE